MTARLLCLATCLFAGLSSTVSFNLETPSPIVFSTSPSEAFGYKLVQLNEKDNNWLVVSAPSFKNSSGDLQGKLYKCPVTSSSSSPGRCQQIFTTLPNDFLQVKDLHLGLTLVKDTSLSRVLACGPTGELDCGSNAFLRGSCLVHDDSFRIHDHFNVGLAQGCPMHPVDVAVLMDGSGSVRPIDFERAKTFVIELMKSFKNRDAQLAVVQYSTQSRTELSFSQYKNNPEKIISAIKRKTGGTNTATAINDVLENIFVSRSGGRDDAKKILVIITDGQSQDSKNYPSVTRKAEKMKVIRYAIGVGNAFQIGSQGRRELETMASKPISDYVFSVTNFNFLSQLLKQLEEKIFAIEGEGDVETSFEMELASAGLSAHLTDGNILLGAAGAYEWRGTVISKTPVETVVGKRTLTPTSLSDKDGYLGYSVTTVQHGGHKHVVSGAPRWQHKGSVFLFDIHKTSKQIIVKQRLTSFQLGSYFGAEVCDVDLQGDGNTDLLLVSAPLFHTHGDEGRVYIYTPLRNGFWMFSGKILEGDSREIWSRFGSALAELADLDGDGLHEVAVGAPHEGDHSGAVYIFRGRRDELQTTPIQRISSSTAGPSFKLFGRSLYGKLDQTGDRLPDVAIGTQGSAVLLRSRPVVNIRATMTFNPEKIPLVESRCSSTADANSNIIQMKICFETTAVNFRPSSGIISFSYVVELESRRRTSRATLLGGARRREEFLKDVPYKHCLTQQVALNCKEKDVVNPIIITVEFFLPKKVNTPGEGPQFIMNYLLSQRITQKLNFEKDCGDDNVCIPDLSLTARPTIDTLILGHDQVLTMNFTVRNKGEDSFFTVLHVVYPSLFYFKETDDGIKCGIPEKDTTKELVNLKCDVNYPVFKKSVKFSFKIQFEVGVIKYSLSSIAIQANVSSDDELPKTLFNNNANAVVRVLYAINTVLKGNVQSHVSLNRTEKNNQILWFYFKVDNQGQPVKNLSLEITIPCAFKGQDFLTFDQPQLSHSVSCKTKQLEAPGKSQAAGPWDATNTASQSWKCHITSLKRRELTQVTLKGNLIVTTLTRLNIEKVKMKSEAHLRYDTSVFKQVSEEMAQYNKLILPTDFIFLEMTNYIPIMVGTSVGGLLLLLIISAILYKVGFFNRNYKAKMAGESGAGNTDDVVSTTQSNANLPQSGQ